MMNKILRGKTINLMVLILGFLLFNGTCFSSISKAQANVPQYQNKEETQVLAMKVSPQNYTQPKVTLQLHDVLLPEALHKLSRQVHVGISFDYEHIPDKKINYHCVNKDFYKVLNDLLQGTNLKPTLSDDHKVVIIQKVLEVQTGSISGTVTDAKTGMTLPGANVYLKNDATIGATSDKEGEFTINNVEAGSHTLVASFIGYKKAEKKIEVTSGKTLEVNFELKPSARSLQATEIVSTGYQEISQERMTGSFNVVGEEELDKPTDNIATQLIGSTAGLNAVSLDEDGNPTFQIRGLSTLYGNREPLIVVDGYPIEGDFESVNPNNVKSISVLKDAAAASIWGVRAANGVIVIKTKRAEKNEPLHVEVSSFYKIGNKFDLGYARDLASPKESIEYERLLYDHNWVSYFVNNGRFPDDIGQALTPVSVALNEYRLGNISKAEMNQRISQLETQDNSDQIRNNLLANPVNKQYNIRISGGSSTLSNNFSLLYNDNQSNFKGTSNKKYQLNYHGNAKITKWLHFDFSTMVQYRKLQNNGLGLGDIKSFASYKMLKNPDGSLTNISQYYGPLLEQNVPVNKFPYSDWTYNPIQEMNSRDLSTTQRNVRVEGGLTLDLLKGLSLNSKIKYENFNSDNRNLYSEKSFYVRSTVNEATEWDRITGTFNPNLPEGSILSESSNNVEAYNWRNQLRFKRDFGYKHQVNFVAGSEIRNHLSKGTYPPTTYGYNDDRLTVGRPPNGPGYAHQLTDWLGNTGGYYPLQFSYTNSYSYRTDRYFSLYGNLSYTYNNKYGISGSYRTDASNIITDDPQYRYAPFWSIGGKWQMANEQFMQDFSWIDRLDIRLTYGYNGNVDKSTTFRPLIGYSSSSNKYYDQSAYVSSYGNPTLRWEKTGTINLGFDYSFFEGKLYGKLDFYRKKGTDLIADVSIPAVNGTTSQKLNNAGILNKGIEATIGTSYHFNDEFIWNGKLTFAYNHNEITSLKIANYQSYNLYGGGTGAYVEGENANSLWSYVYTGIRDKQPTVRGENGAYYTFKTFAPGDATNYMRNSGPLVAPYTFGFTSSFRVRNFDFSFILSGKFGYVFRQRPFNRPFRSGRILPNSRVSDVLNGDPDEIVPMPLNDPEPRFYFWDRFYPYMDYLATNAAHIRIQQVNLTYRLPADLLNKINFDGNLNIYVQANDLHTFLFNDEGIDPEYPIGTVKPAPKFTLGAKLNF